MYSSLVYYHCLGNVLGILVFDTCNLSENVDSKLQQRLRNFVEQETLLS